MPFLLAIIAIVVILSLVLNNDDTFTPYTNNTWIKPASAFSMQWRTILIQKVNYYSNLKQEEKVRFEYKIQEFLLNCKVTGIKTIVETEDKLLVAASAVIPIFGFEEWKYTNLDEVLLYPDTFNHDFETEGPDRNILGMVGTGFMEGSMILSKPALHLGFSNESDKMNVAIHEFVHLIDKMDDNIDGIPANLMDKQYAIPWIDLMSQKMEEIYKSKSDINPYGGTNKAEFFAVASEYFFERPKLLERKHPKLYALLEEVFNQDMSKRNLQKRRREIGRNSPCPCDSCKKFKKCCGR